MEINIKVDGQKLKIPIQYKHSLYAGTDNFIKLQFSFSDDWDDMIKKICFEQKDTVVIDVLDTNSSCYISNSIEKGKCNISLLGTKTDSNQTICATTEKASITLLEGTNTTLFEEPGE